MALVSDIITAAFLDIGAIAAGQTPNAQEQADAFMRLNMMMDSWSREHLSVFTETHGSYPLVAATSAYTFGLTGTMATTAQPMRIYGASGVSGAFRSPVKVVSFAKFHAEIEDGRGVTAVLPQALAVDAAFPLFNLKVFPTPAPSPGNLELDYWTEIAQFVTVGDTLALPPGFQDALHFNLAVKLYPQYAKSGGIDQALLLNAQQTKAAITALNAAVQGAAAEEAPPAPQPKAA